jgi:hypothetical protein
MKPGITASKKIALINDSRTRAASTSVSSTVAQKLIQRSQAHGFRPVLTNQSPGGTALKSVTSAAAVMPRKSDVESRFTLPKPLCTFYRLAFSLSLTS